MTELSYNGRLPLSTRRFRARGLSSAGRADVVMDATPTETALETLLAQCAKGDQAAFARLYGLTNGKLLSVCRSFFRHGGEAEEVLQEAYLRIWRASPKYSASRGRPMTWMITVARHTAIDRLRQTRQERALTVDSATEPGGEDADLGKPAEAERSDVAYDMSRGLAGLEEGPRRAITLAFYFGYTHEELAQELDVPLGTAKSWIRRGLVKLKAGLEP